MHVKCLRRASRDHLDGQWRPNGTRRVVVESNYELMTREPRKIARKRFMMFSCTIISREEHIKSRHESKNQKVFKSDFKEVLYSTAKIIYSQPYPSHSELDLGN